MAGLISRVLSFTKTALNGEKFLLVKADPGGIDNYQGKNFGDGGEDSPPLAVDLCFSVESQKTGNQATVGYYDPKNQQKSNGGEKRIYGRDSDGNQVSEVYLENSGKVTATNDNSSVILQPEGTINAFNDSANFNIDISGQVEMLNGFGFIKLLPNGFVNINGVIFDPNGNIQGAGFIKDVNGAGVTEHEHTQADDSGGNSEQNTGQAIP